MSSSVCVVFAGRQGLDNSNDRFSIARVPEVSHQLREAQNYFDNLEGTNQNIDLFNFLSSSDQEFSAQPKLRSLVAAIVQIGLFKRYTKFYNTPGFIVGNTNQTSALKVCSGKMSLIEMISQSPFVQNLVQEDSSMFSGQETLEDTTLTGLCLEEYGLVKQSDGQFNTVHWSTKDCYGLLKNLQLDYQVEQFIHIGPAFDFRIQDLEKKDLRDIALSNSIDMDPILNSFWKTA